MLTFMYNFLHDRKIKVKIGKSLSELYNIENVLPQSSSISVTLFLIAINDIFYDIQNPIKYTLKLMTAVYSAVVSTLKPP